jgi:hypothetical protein
MKNLRKCLKRKRSKLRTLSRIILLPERTPRKVRIEVRDKVVVVVDLRLDINQI